MREKDARFGWLSPYEFAQYWSIKLAQYSLSSNACNDSHALLTSEGRDRAEVVLVVVAVLVSGSCKRGEG